MSSSAHAGPTLAAKAQAVTSVGCAVRSAPEHRSGEEGGEAIHRCTQCGRAATKEAYDRG